MDDLFLRLEAQNFFLRVDRNVLPTMMHGAIASESEVTLLRQIEGVVRLGHVRRIGRGSMVLEHGDVATPKRAVHVHCAAAGLAKPPLRPIFEPGHLTVQPMMWGFASHQFALLGVAEAMVASDEEKNRLCRPTHYWDRNVDFLTAYRALFLGEQARAAHPQLSAWSRQSRLNPLGRLGEHRENPKVIATRAQVKAFGAAALPNISKLLAGRGETVNA